MARLLAIGFARFVHAWAWTVAWLLLVQRLVLSHSMNVVLAAALSLVFMWLIYLPLMAWRTGGGDDAIEDLGLGTGKLSTLVGCICGSVLLLGFFNFLGHWDKRGPGSGAVLVAAVLLHGAAMGSIALGERWLRLRGDEDD